MAQRLRGIGLGACAIALLCTGAVAPPAQASAPNARVTWATAAMASAVAARPMADTAVPTSVAPARLAPGVLAPGVLAPRTATPRSARPMAARKPLTGKVVMLDPGHGYLTKARNRMVSDGRGGRKVCQVAGTATARGYAERDFNLDVAKRTAALLRAQGATVVLTRTSHRTNPCAPDRGLLANRRKVDAWISIHADGNVNTRVKGYFAIVSSPPLSASQRRPSQRLATSLLRAMKRAGFTQNKAYRGGLSKRADIAGLNVNRRPAVMMELGEMKNPAEARLMSTKSGRQRYARALASGISAYLRS